MNKNKYINLAFISLFLSCCKVTVSPMRPIDDNAQSKHNYENLELEFVETRTASQKGAAIVIADLLLEAKSKHGNVTITNIREQKKKSGGKVTYYVIYDIVKIKNK